MLDRLNKIVKFIKERNDFQVDIGLVLGSGLGDYARNLKTVFEVDYSEIEGFPTSSVQGHEGKFIFGYLNGKRVVCMKGRVHYYEGYSMSEVTLPIRVMGLLGVEKIILTNAAGGINFDFKPGDLMMITDHISFHVPSPLIGKNYEELGSRFVDMSNVYNKNIQNIIVRASEKLNIDLKKGVYVQFSGPQYETPTEIKAFRNEGADAVGMSTVVEAIVATHMGIEVGAISCITNMACGILDKPISHEEVQETASLVKEKFEALINEVITNL